MNKRASSTQSFRREAKANQLLIKLFSGLTPVDRYAMELTFGIADGIIRPRSEVARLTGLSEHHIDVVENTVLLRLNPNRQSEVVVIS